MQPNFFTFPFNFQLVIYCHVGINDLEGRRSGVGRKLHPKCGHLSCFFKIIGFHSIYTIHSSYLNGGTNSCPITRIAVDSEVLYHGDYILHRPFQARRRGGVQTKTFRKDSEASSRAERWRGYVILFSNEPSCCHAATSERRRIRLKADYHCFALRGASIRRSQRSNSEAVLFRGTLPRRCSIRRSQ